MGNIETLQNKLLEKVQATGEAQVQALQEKLNRALEDYQSSLAKQLEHEKESMVRKEEQTFDIRKQSLTNELRNTQLTHKQGLLEQIIQEVPSYMNQKVGQEMNQLIRSAIQQLNSQQAMDLTIGGQSRAFLTDQELQDLQQEFSQLTIHEGSQQQSGFNLSQAGMNLNFFFEDVINELKPQLLIELEKHLKA